MSNPERKSKTRERKSRFKPERNFYDCIGGLCANAVWIFNGLALLCFAIGHPGWGWCFLILSVIPIVLFLVIHVAITILCQKTVRHIPHR